MKQVLMIFVVLAFCYPTMAQNVPGTLSYQGILMQNDGITPIVDGAHSIVFNFYTVSSGGSVLFSRTISVTTARGLYTCIIGGGSAPNAPFNSTEMNQIGSQQVFIGITVDGGSELAPRAQLTTSPYTFQAQTAYSISASTVIPDANLEATIDRTRFNASDYITAQGGVHVGGTSDPGADNLVVDGTISSNGTGESHFTGPLSFSSIGNCVTNPPSSSLAKAFIFGRNVCLSGGVELYAMDGSGNITNISPHNFSMISQSEPMAWSFYSENKNIGQRINVDMLRSIRLIESLSGEKLVYIEATNGTEIEPYSNESKTKSVSDLENELEQLNARVLYLEQKLIDLIKVVEE